MTSTNPVRTDATTQPQSAKPIRRLHWKQRSANLVIDLPTHIPVQTRRDAVRELADSVRTLASERPDAVIEISARDFRAVVKEMAGA